MSAATQHTPTPNTKHGQESSLIEVLKRNKTTYIDAAVVRRHTQSQVPTQIQSGRKQRHMHRPRAEKGPRWSRRGNMFRLLLYLAGTSSMVAPRPKRTQLLQQKVQIASNIPVADKAAKRQVKPRILRTSAGGAQTPAYVCMYDQPTTRAAGSMSLDARKRMTQR